MKYTLTLLMLFAGMNAFSQEWYSANRKLKPPKETDDYYATIGYFDRYDTVPCIYIRRGSTELHKGFKLIHVHNGDYTDNRHTFRVFFDNQMHRIYNVDRFCFNQ